MSDDDLSLLTLDDIRARIAQKLATSKEQDSWRTLAKVVDELDQARNSGATSLVSRRWTLSSVRLCGFRGVAQDLSFEVDPTPGITVVHGPNGSGKSSIADAVEIVLGTRAVGGYLERVTGTNRDVWNVIERAQGTDRTEAEVVLSDGDSRLRFVTVWEGDAPVRSATLTEHGTTVPVELDGAWSELMAGHNPVCAYASLERQVQIGGDLTDFLRNRLALGENFQRLLQIVTDHQSSATDAARKIANAWRDASKDLRSADEAWGSDSGEEVPGLDQPPLDSDPDRWMQEQGLADLGAVLPELSRAAVRQVRADAASARHALDSLARSAADDVAWGEQLERLHDAAQHDPHDGECPVCGANTPWFTVLSAGVQARRAVREARRVADAAVLRLRRVTTSENPALVGALSDTATHARKIVQGIRDLDGATAESGRHAARTLADLLTSTDGETALEEAVARSDRAAQWRRQRAAAITPYLSVWKAQGEAASSKARWEAVAKRCKILSNEFTAERSGVLRKKADAMVGELLKDAGLVLSEIDVKAKDAVVHLKDPAGRVLKLAMLSAGQRNAVLLAPLIGAIGSNPFGFLVMDDPVHAFDDLRVDALAASLARIGKDRRVIVLTHDERLRQHLRARSTRVEVQSIARNAATGEVVLTPRDSVALDLLDDAAELLAELGKAPINHDTTYTVRGLCRFAVKNALRQDRLRRAILAGEDTTAVNASLDEARTLRGCITYVKQSDDQGHVDPALATVSAFLRDWERAAHHDGEISTNLAAEIAAARQACEQLIGSVSAR